MSQDIATRLSLLGVFGKRRRATVRRERLGSMSAFTLTAHPPRILNRVLPICRCSRGPPRLRSTPFSPARSLERHFRVPEASTDIEVCQCWHSGAGNNAQRPQRQLEAA
jgi:hypothetical protein